MNKRLSLLISYILLLACVSCHKATRLDANYHIVPRPSSILLERGAPFLLSSNTQITYSGNDSVMGISAALLSQYIKEVTGYQLPVLKEEEAKQSKRTINLALTDLLEDKPERYQIQVKSHEIEVRSASEEGLFYAIQSLRKFIPSNNENACIAFPSVLITDSPSFPYRGVLLDVSRHMFSVDFIKRFIDLMALHNLNFFHWHLTDNQNWRIEIRKYPQLGLHNTPTTTLSNSQDSIIPSPKNYYTQDEIREVVRYASKRFITVIPEINMPTQMMSALKAYPQLRCEHAAKKSVLRWEDINDVICTGNDSSLVFLKDIMDEVTELFPSEYIHVGSNFNTSIHWKHCAKCQAFIKKNKLKESASNPLRIQLERYMLNEMEHYLSQKGRHIMGWNITHDHDLSCHSVDMCWKSGDNNIDAIRRNNQVIMAPSNILYFDHYQYPDSEREPLATAGCADLQQVYLYNPMPDALTPGQQQYIIGGEASLWTHYIRSDSEAEYMLLPRLAAMSEVLWSGSEKKDFGDFLQRMKHMCSLYELYHYKFARHYVRTEQKNLN